MRVTLPLLLLGGGLLYTADGPTPLSAQSQVITAPTRTTPPPQPKAAEPRRAPTPRPALPTRAVIPDPDLFDGTKFPPEPRSEHGMVADFEVAGSDRATEDSAVGGGGSATGGAPAEEEEGGGGGAPAASGGDEESAENQPPPAGGGGGEEGPDDLPETDAAGGGMQIEQQPEGGMQGPGGAAAAAGTPADAAPTGRPSREVALGAPDMQIALPPGAKDDSVGGRQTDQQQEHERAMARGRQTDNRNRGVERGANMPSDI